MISLKIHSTVDVITNSSTVIYTMATKQTINAAKTLINSILQLAESDLTEDALFDFSIELDEDDVKNWRRDRLDNDGFDGDHDELTEYYQSIVNGETDKPDWWDDYKGHHDLYDEYLIVKPKVENELTTMIAKTLEGFLHTYVMEGEFN